MGVSKNRGKTPKMDGLFHGNPYEQMDDLGGKTTPIFGSTPICNIHMHISIPRPFPRPSGRHHAWPETPEKSCETSKEETTGGAKNRGWLVGLGMVVFFFCGWRRCVKTPKRVGKVVVVVVVVFFMWCKTLGIYGS